MTCKRRCPFLCLALAGLLSVTGCTWPFGETEGKGTLILPGTVEAHEVPLAFLVGGRISKLHADEGDRVEAGEVVATLDPVDLQLALTRAEAEQGAARATLAAFEAGTREQEIRVGEANLNKARADLKLAKLQLERVTRLAPEDVVSEERIDEVRRQEAVAQAEVAQAGEALKLLREGPRKEDIERARAGFAAATSVADAARRQLGYAQLVSPVAGLVTVRMAEQGEVVAPGQPVIRVAELDRPWIRAYLAEPDLARVRVGQEATIRLDGLPGQLLHGRLTYISAAAEFTPKVVETRELREDLVYRIKVEVDDPEHRLKIGMPADVTLTREASS